MGRARPGPSVGGVPQDDAAAYAVLTEVLEVMGRRVLDASATAEGIAAHPGSVPASVAAAGSAALGVAASDFADAWTRECQVLARETRLLGDGLVRVAAAYRGTEWAVGEALSPGLAAWSRTGGRR